jgi:NADH:ubiquinone oxidoreductase subunit
MSFEIRLYTWLFGKFAGKDQFGNRYYTSKKAQANGRLRRWVVYKGAAEASKIPPLWHGWMHHMTDIIPSETPDNYSWQKEPLPNLTGTDHAYLPPGHILNGGVRKKATGDYEAWQP